MSWMRNLRKIFLLKFESRYMSKSLTNKLLLKKNLHGLKLMERSALDQHINVFN